MMINVEIKKVKDLKKEDLDFINSVRRREFGMNSEIDFEKKPYLNGKIIFVKDNNEIVSFGLLLPIKIRYLGVNYNILGIASIISVKKGKGYGKILIEFIVGYLKKKNKTGLGFCEYEKADFYKKSGLEIEKDFIKRFIYKNPEGEEIMDENGIGLYYQGKDRFIEKVLNNPEPVYIDVVHW